MKFFFLIQFDIAGADLHLYSLTLLLFSFRHVLLINSERNAHTNNEDEWLNNKTARYKLMRKFRSTTSSISVSELPFSSRLRHNEKKSKRSCWNSLIYFFFRWNWCVLMTCPRAIRSHFREENLSFDFLLNRRTRKNVHFLQQLFKWSHETKLKVKKETNSTFVSHRWFPQRNIHISVFWPVKKNTHTTLEITFITLHFNSQLNQVTNSAEWKREEEKWMRQSERNVRELRRMIDSCTFLSVFQFFLLWSWLINRRR